jgi:imidazolonepropionase
MRDLTIIEDGALLIENGLISEVGPTRRVENLAAAQRAEVIDATGCVVAPGFVDAHTHLLEATRRGARSWSPARLESEARTRLNWLSGHGTTTAGAMAEDARDLRVLAALADSPVQIVATMTIPAEGFGEHLPAVRFVSSDTTDLAVARKQLAECRRAGFSVRLHGGAAALAALEFGAVTVEHYRPAEHPAGDLLERSAVILTMTPGVEYQAGCAAVDARQLIDRGACLALGSEFRPTTTMAGSMAAAVSMACAQMGMTPAEAFTAATMNGAHALGVPRAVGSLELGKQADVVIFSVPDYREVPAALGLNLVRLTLKRGQVVTPAVC